MDLRYIIYGLCDPRTGELRYIGKSSSGLTRPRVHFRNDRTLNDGSHVHNWCKSILAIGLEPEIVVLEQYESTESLRDAEIRLIAFFRKMGYRLANLTAGGDGLNGFRHSQSTREKLSRSRTGSSLSDDHKKAISRSLSGYRRKPRSPSHRINHMKSRGTSVVCLSDGRKFFSGNDAARFYGIPMTTFKRSLKLSKNIPGTDLRFEKSVG